MTEVPVAITDRVKEHAHRAWDLSHIEMLPPGYTQQMWAVLLMDNSYAALQVRYKRKIERWRQIWQQTEQDPARPPQLSAPLPAMTKVPPEMAAKARHLRDQWLREYIQERCQNVLKNLAGSLGDPRVEVRAQALLKDELTRLTHEQGSLPFEVQVDLGGQTIRVTCNPKRRGH